jgi:hypothetical protein
MRSSSASSVFDMISMSDTSQLLLVIACINGDLNVLSLGMDADLKQPRDSLSRGRSTSTVPTPAPTDSELREQGNAMYLPPIRRSLQLLQPFS